MAFIKIFSGGIVEVQRVKQTLQEQGIEPIVKDSEESATLAGFGSLMPDFQELFVHSDQEEKSKKIIDSLA